MIKGTFQHVSHTFKHKIDQSAGEQKLNDNHDSIIMCEYAFLIDWNTV